MATGSDQGLSGPGECSLKVLLENRLALHGKSEPLNESSAIAVEVALARFLSEGRQSGCPRKRLACLRVITLTSASPA